MPFTNRPCSAWPPALRLAAALLLAIGAGCTPDSQLGEAAARERLRREIHRVHREQDSAGLLNLYYLEGVKPRDLRLIRFAIENEIGLPVREVRFTNLTPNDGIDYTFEGEAYGPTLEPELKMEVEYATEDRLTVAYLIGFHEGEYRLVTARPTGAEAAE